MFFKRTRRETEARGISETLRESQSILEYSRLEYVIVTQ